MDLFLAKHNVEYSMSIPRRDKGCTPILVRLLRQINRIKPCGKYQNLYLFCLFGLRLYVSVNHFSVMSGWSHRFLGITSTFGEVNVSCSRIQHGDPSEDRTPTSRSYILYIRCSSTRPRRLPNLYLCCRPSRYCAKWLSTKNAIYGFQPKIHVIWQSIETKQPSSAAITTGAGETIPIVHFCYCVCNRLWVLTGMEYQTQVGVDD